MVDLGHEPRPAHDKCRPRLQNAMPGNVGTSRAKFEEKDLATKFPVAPVSVVQFFG